MRYQSLFWHNCLMKQVNKLKWIDVNIFPTVRSIQRSLSAFASLETDRNNKWGLWRQVTKRRSKKLQCSTLLSLCIWVQGCFLDEVWYSFVLSLTNRPQSWHSIAYFWLCSTLFFFMQAAREEAFLWNRQKPNFFWQITDRKGGRWGMLMKSVENLNYRCWQLLFNLLHALDIC